MSQQTSKAPAMSKDGRSLPYSGALRDRYSAYQKALQFIDTHEGGLDRFTQGHKKMGFQIDDKGGVTYREWAAGAVAARLIGDFNNWSHTANPMTKNEFGVWECYVPPTADGKCAIPHDSMVKISMTTADGESIDRLPAWITRVTQDLDVSPVYDARFWNPPAEDRYEFKNGHSTNSIEGLKIYEAHVGISSPEKRVTTYKEFERDVLPRIKDLGYNTIQILNMFDGTDHLYFHEGSRGRHDLWDSRLFNYGHPEVQRFLLSNLRFWMDEYNFDGFRFDGVTSMMYKHHGDYHEYFGDSVDQEAMVYLMLANKMIHDLYPNAITIAEDVSGMPTLCRPVDEGGVGFDYRLSMAIPDMWIKILKEKQDEEWDMGNIVHTLTNRRHLERSVSRCVRDNVGVKLTADDYMSDLSPLTPIIDRGISLHKMIRFLVHSLGGEAYLNFEGNEWMDFPREGNGNSFDHARRQFNLVDDHLLRYKYLNAFDAEMNNLESKYKWLSAPQVSPIVGGKGMLTLKAFVSLKHEGDKVIVFERAGLLFIFNCELWEDDYRVGVDVPGKYHVVLNSDEKRFGGHDRIDNSGEYFTTPMEWNGRKNWLQVLNVKVSAFAERACSIDVRATVCFTSMSSITSSTMPFLETLNGLIEPLLFIGLSLSYVPSTISQVFRERRLVSWDQFQFLWFGNFWRTVGPMVRDGAEARVVPLLQGRVRLGTAVPPDGDSRGLPPGVGGTVIEVGPGSGMWVSIYGDQYATLSDTVDKSIPGKRTRVEKVFGIEPNATHHAALQSRISEAGLDGSYTIVPVGIEDIGSTGLIPKGSVDAIVTVLCLCSIPEPEKNIRELYEYLKPGGRWFVYEHVKCYASQGNFMRWYQSKSLRAAGPWKEIDLAMPTDAPWWSTTPHSYGILTKP
ncbi:1,4-alpha-glucan branching enzyme [Trichosporon asahii var. asahii CBS 2479]|uniref:1,4-alpha-glucan-branching enzyme n=1 Tax=Trichosporon asahii var. asahii (strain ATCC 90039 / CBS 2479 / JCM 2466 / KCTC 7840 / NBRC 103889/ NCYC 2677 / UAMH 7654) TaxID=1186058 RepID=J5SYY4_TRIAS|nr:1,4-alpha-glucan branching enzyme [Trichosporon asahii var. asahii CBS 2479]EJT48281.1 1,4-alpha-glucan branching enzyme [Trichosporon asahii var. asahii CBS 2479]